MKSKVSSLLSKFSMVSVLNSLALVAVIHSAQACCAWYMYQPEMPESAKRFIKE